MLTNLEFVVFPFALLVSYILFNRCKLYLSRRKFAKENSCKEPRCRVPLRDPLFGSDFVLKTIQNAKQFRYLEGTHERFQQYGSTFTAKHMTYPTIHTIEPANIKHVLATRFEDFKLSTFRVDALTPLFGKGIFSIDGNLWSHSRALLRPSFARHNMADHLPLMESHFEHFIKAIPRDGSTIDLQKLFCSFTTDTATEFLFGHSVHTLCDKEEGTSIATEVSDSEFVDVYKRYVRFRTFSLLLM